MLQRWTCCFTKGGACERASKVDNDDAGVAETTAAVEEKEEQVVAEEKKVAKSGPKEAGKSSSNKSPILVELFTSQGCSSCPPADLLISQLGHRKSQSLDTALQVPIIVLAFHVEYWDYLGWRDPLASSIFTLRQRNYGQSLQQDSIYTPEVVVQGRSHCIASGLEPILGLIHSAPCFPALDVNASWKKTSESESSMDVSLGVSLKFKVEGYTVDVMVAMYENGLVTSVEKGENKGRILTNDFVVRCLIKAASLQDWAAKKIVNVDVTLPLWEGFNKSRAGVVLFLQNPSTMEVYGSQVLHLPD